LWGAGCWVYLIILQLTNGTVLHHVQVLPPSLTGSLCCLFPPFLSTHQATSALLVQR
jgi:hypothetical protein